MASTKMTLERAKRIVQAVPHSETCCRGAADPYEAVYGKPDPDCPPCKALGFARTRIAAKMFA